MTDYRSYNSLYPESYKVTGYRTSKPKPKPTTTSLHTSSTRVNPGVVASEPGYHIAIAATTTTTTSTASSRSWLLAVA